MFKCNEKGKKKEKTYFFFLGGGGLVLLSGVFNVVMGLGLNSHI